MKLEVGKYYVTRSGKKVKCLATDFTDGEPRLPVVMAILDADEEFGSFEFYQYTSNGRTYFDEDEVSCTDIVGPWEEPIMITHSQFWAAVRECRGYHQANVLQSDWDPIARAVLPIELATKLGFK